ncbi:MAG: flagellar basal body-associated FliL family protein [Pseudomonadota bacterium]
MADEEEQAQEEEKSGGKMKIVLMVVGVVILLAAGTLGGPMVMNMISPPEDDAEEVVEEPASKPPIYQSLHPPLIVNFKDQFGDAHFMQMTLELMSRDQDVINAVRDHAPVIRNDLILLYASSMYEEVVTREGKEKMLAEGLAEVQRIMTESIGEPGVEALYFTGLVIQ